MVAPAAISDRAAERQPRAAGPLLAAAVLAAATVMLVALAGYLVWRRACGGLQQPLGAAALWAVGAGGTALVGAIRGGWQWVGRRPGRRDRSASVLWLLPVLAVLALLATLALPGTSGLGQVAAWGSVLASEAVWLAVIWRSRNRDVAAPQLATEPGASAAGGAARAGWPLPAERHGEGPALPALPPDVSQQLTRFHTLHQGEVAEGVLRAVFAPGQRSRNVHVAFCPPLPGRPQVDVAQVAGPALRVKVADAQAFGVRFDVRLQAASPREEDVMIRFQARCEP